MGFSEAFLYLIFDKAAADNLKLDAKIVLGNMNILWNICTF